MIKILHSGAGQGLVVPLMRHAELPLGFPVTPEHLLHRPGRGGLCQGQLLCGHK